MKILLELKRNLLQIDRFLFVGFDVRLYGVE
jgi:hypothetical protein